MSDFVNVCRLCVPSVVLIRYYSSTLQSNTSAISVGGFLPSYDGLEATIESSILSFLTYCQKRSSIFEPSSVHFRFSDFTRATFGAINPGLSMMATVTSAIVYGDLPSFLTVLSINDSRATDRRLSTFLCWPMRVSNTNLVIASST